MAVVNELITKFGFKAQIGPLTKMNKTLGTTAKGISIVSGAALAATAAISKFVLGTVTGIDSSVGSIVQLSRVTGVAVEKIQSLGMIASISGSSVGAVKSTIDSLTARIGSAAWKGDENFARFGITVRKSNGELKKADQVLAEIQDRFQSMNLSMQEKVHFAGQLGIDKSLVQLMSKSGDEMDSLMAKARKLGTLTKGDADAAADLNDSMAMLKFGLSAVQNQLAVGLAPHMQQFSDMVVEVLGEKKGLISKGVGKAVELFVSFGKAVKDLFPVIGLLAAIGAVVAFIFSPAAALSVGISAFLLVIQDLMVAFRGGKSTIGEFMKAAFSIDITPGMKAIVEWAKGLKTIFVELIRYIGDYLKAFGSLAGAAGALSGGDFKQAGKLAMDAFDYIFRPGMVDTKKYTSTTTSDNSTKTINQTNYFSGNASSDDTANKVMDMMSDAIDQANRGGM